MSDQDEKPKSTNKIIELQYPFKWKTGDGEQLIEKVELRRPKGKHLKGLTKNVGMFEMFQIAAKVAVEDYVTPAFFDEMDAADCMEVTEVIGDFLDNGRETGPTT